MRSKSNLLFGLAVAAAAFAGVKALRRIARRYDFREKVVVITGGSRGLGLVMAREFAARGAHIAICARDDDELQRAEADLRHQGANVFAAVCDIRDRLRVESFIEQVRSKFGEIDVLVNNAGIIQVGPLELQTQDDFADALNVHFWGPFYAVQAILPEMRQRRDGRIINIVSIGGKLAVPHLAPYSASKFALSGMSSAMRVELIKDNIYVTTVYPGLMRTGSHVNALFKGQNKKEYALFSIMDALPFTSVSAESAARQVVDASARGDAELVISLNAKLAAKLTALFPGLISDLEALSARLLPGEGGIGSKMATGLESTSAISPSVFTTLADAASYRNNELKPGESIS